MSEILSKSVDDKESVEKEGGSKKEGWGLLVPKDETQFPHQISLCGEEFSIGRSNKCSFRIEDHHISGTHVKIFFQLLQSLTLVSIVDRSSNGTFLNNIRLEKGKRYFLRHLDQLSLVHASSKKWSFSFIDLSFAERSEHSKIEGKYDLHENIGEGTFSVVKKGVRKETGEAVAVKVIDKSRFMHEVKTQEQVHREVNILKQIKHPYIISIHDVVETDRWLYIILELATGGDLFRSLEIKKSFSEKDAKRIFSQILDALDYLHNTLHTAHRDLKPENILLESDDYNANIKLTDFGLARIVDHKGQMTTMCGTPEYVAPEILFGFNNSNSQSSQSSTQEEGYGVEVDMWSAGVLLYILLSGTLAFHNSNKKRLYQRIRSGTFFFEPKSRWDNISDEAKDLITKLIEVDPKKRFDVTEALSHPWLTGEEKEETQLDIKEELQRTLSQGSLSFNVADMFTVDTEDSDDTKLDDVGPLTPEPSDEEYLSLLNKSPPKATDSFLHELDYPNSPLFPEEEKGTKGDGDAKSSFILPLPLSGERKRQRNPHEEEDEEVNDLQPPTKKNKEKK